MTSTETADYQVMPPLTTEEYAALEAEILARGILVPILVDQHGNILDGHHRHDITTKHGLDCPRETRHVEDDEHARDIAFTLNLARRHLTREQKRALIVAEITRRPDDSDRAIGRRLACDHKTVGAVRRELGGEIPHPQLTADQRRRSGILFHAMQHRTMAAANRILDDEDVTMYDLATTLEGDDQAVLIDASMRHWHWCFTNPELEGIFWSELAAEEV